ncbi:YhdH/YhfP family quinone oxidoreductase [Rhodohalobacter sp. 8-1]|uniref:YhdH/YhfP family quinone oxidoreductase n=1 Tax=Rhodohalobacter sp. 8-1 TaxID=3131972 RepID=UPI0030EEF687
MKPDITYKALVAGKRENGEKDLSIQSLKTSNLPGHDVLIRVHYSSLNYKDALSASGDPGVTKSYPHTPGIDAAGVVEWSDDDRFNIGDKVVVTGYDLGQNTAGGFGEYICVPGDWVVPLPESLSLKESMILGTAGFTAAYGVKKIVDQGIEPDEDYVLVTGATGGVGSLTVSILSRVGYRVMAVTGKKEEKSFLKSIGASEIISRESVTEISGAPLQSSRWAAAIDTVGGEMLDAVLRQAGHNGVVACCGNILGGRLETSIYPFILRGISLMGIDSGNCLMSARLEIWDYLAGDWKPSNLEKLSHTCIISDLPQEIEKILDGRQAGRIVVSLRD